MGIEHLNPTKARDPKDVAELVQALAAMAERVEAKARADGMAVRPWLIRQIVREDKLGITRHRYRRVPARRASVRGAGRRSRRTIRRRARSPGRLASEPEPEPSRRSSFVAEVAA